jgi:hypothetical protein
MTFIAEATGWGRVLPTLACLDGMARAWGGAEQRRQVACGGRHMWGEVGSGLVTPSAL